MSRDAGSIIYNFGAIEEVTGQIKSFESNMDASLTALYSQFTNLFAADWQGQAGTACDDARRKWNQGADEIRSALALLGVRLAEGSHHIHSLDSSIAASM